MLPPVPTGGPKTRMRAAVVPLATSWKLSSSGQGVRLIPQNGRVRFEIVEREADHSAATVKGGDGSCPFPECRRSIDGDEIKAQSQAGRVGQQLYCVVYKKEQIVGYAKNGNAKTEKVRGFRAPRPEDDVGSALPPCRLQSEPTSRFLRPALWQADSNFGLEGRHYILDRCERDSRLLGLSCPGKHGGRRRRIRSTGRAAPAT